MMSLVSLVASSNSSFRNAIEESLDLMRFSPNSNPQNIVIMPDLCYYWDPSTGQTTNPNFVADLIDSLRERTSYTSEVSIAASDTQAGQCKSLFRFLGYEKVAKEKKVKLVNLSEDNHKEARVKIANHLYTFLNPSIMKNADLFVNVPKMKLWPKTKISCALKNVYNSNMFSGKLTHRSCLDELIVVANKVVKPNLCLVDGIMVRGKHTKKLGLVMSSSDPVAIDAAAAKIMGLNPKSIDHIVLAEKEGIGALAYNTVGESISQFAKAFPSRKLGDRIWTMFSGAGLVTLKKFGRRV